uniref:Uncharacterized protein n=1 Tax=Ciona intestinalis TaxID=7719 RepID=H2Y017_CIOIN
MDPWGSPSTLQNGNQANHTDEFQDSFLSSGQQQQEDTEEKLENSYLNDLEAKLKRIQNMNKKSVKAKDMLESLEFKRQHQYEELLSDHMENTADLFCDDLDSTTPADHSYFDIGRKLYPEQQALNKVEVLALLKHDLLSQQNNETVGELEQDGNDR